MPIDPRIPLGVQSPQIADPVERMLTLRNLAQQQQAAEQDRQIRSQQMQQNERRLASEEQAAGDEAAAAGAATAPDWETALQQLTPQQRLIAEKAKSEIETHRTARQQAAAKQRAAAARGIVAFGYDPGVAAFAFQDIAQDDPSAAQMWAQIKNDPAAIKRVVDYFVTQDPDYKAPETKTRTVKVTNPDGSVTEQIVEDVPGQAFTSAPEAPKDLDAAIFAASKSGDGKELQRLLNLKARTAAAGRAPDDGRLVQIMGPQGTPVWVRESDAVGKPAAQAARAVTGIERQSLAFYNRAQEAATTVEPLEDKIGKMSLAGQARLQVAPNWLQSPENQSYRQAQRAFTEARLRKESGAAIPNAEYENDAKTYFAQPGDTPKMLEQKRAARQTVLDGLAFSSGKAYDEFYGEPMKKGGKPKGTDTDGADALSVTTPDGQTFQFKTKAEADAFKKAAGL